MAADRNTDTNMDVDVDDVDMEVVGSDEDMAIIGREDVSNYNPDHILPEPPAVLARIRQWLQPTPYRHEGGEYRRHLASHAQGTGQWLTATETYKTWHDGCDDGLLWIKGIPGSGKSVFAASIADALAKEGHPVLFFFFRQIIDANHEPVHLLRDWLDQILEYSPPLQRDLKAYIDEDHRELNRKLESLSIDDLWRHLRSALVYIPKVYLVADALDEMDKGNDEFLKVLGRLGSWRPRQAKVLITSRPVSTVEAPLREFSALRIRLDERHVDTDIATYVQHSLEDSGISDEDKVRIKAAVPGRANGLFLYAKLAMDAFLEPGADVGHVLKTLPSDLNLMYTDLLAEHARRSGVPGDIQRLLLGWVTHATRPLRLIEMGEMLRVTYKSSGRQYDRKSAKALVRVACGPLLEIHPDETVSVVHHSLTEFLLGSTRSDDSSPLFPVLEPSPTHELLAVSCIQYLLSSGCLDSFSTSTAQEDDNDPGPFVTDNQVPQSVISLRLEFPFAEYACTNWPTHVARSSGAGAASAALLSAVDSLLTPGEKLKAWLDIEWRSRGVKGVTPCHVAARYGLAQYIQHLLAREGMKELNAADGLGQTPLFHAAERGHVDAAKVLIDAGADPDAEDIVGLKPLHRAASNNHSGVATTLLAAGVSPLTEKTREDPGRWCGNAPRSKGHTPLMYACKAGHVAAVEAFLPFLHDPELVHRALYWASVASQPRVVRRLVQHPGVDVNAKFRGDTALFNACARNDAESIEVLIGAGADATLLCRGTSEEFAGFGNYRVTEESSIAPLEAFCRGTRSGRNTQLQAGELQHVLDLLLRAGADINRRDKDLKTPLHHAAGKPALLRLLLQAGADPNAESADGGTALHANFKGDEGWDVLKLLVEEGKADVNKRRRRDGKTPLRVLLDSRSHDVCLRFIEEFAPDCTIADDVGDTPLHAAAASFTQELRAEVINALIAGGAELGQRNQKGETALHATRDIEGAKHLVSRGADPEAQDNEGRTLLMRSWGARKGVAELLSIGARPDTRDFQGRTLLHCAVRCCSMGARSTPQSILEELDHLVSETGLQPTSVDYYGNTLLHELVQRQEAHRSRPGFSVRLFKGIAERGVDANAANYEGQTVLHTLSAKGETGRLLDVAIALCQNSLDSPDHEGRRPIHLAAAATEAMVAKLVSAGVDVSALTYKSLQNPLHIAASAQESGILGLLLTTVTTAERYSHAASDMIDAVDKENHTPLYYACLSGRPESVSLLLDAGARVLPWCQSLITACSLVGQDEGAKGKLQKKPRRFADLELDFSEHLGTQLDEILRMLVEHGLDLAAKDNYGRNHLQMAISELSRSEADYTARCFLALRDRLDLKPIVWGAPDAAFTHRWAELRREAATRAFHELDTASRVGGNHRAQEDLLLELLQRREFDLVEAACQPGACDLLLPSKQGWTILHALVALGHVSVLAKLATPENVRTLDDPAWRRELEQLSEGRKEPVQPGSILPLVLAACKRRVSNMAVLQLLVEKMNASVNASQYQSDGDEDAEGGNEHKIGDSPLHSLARGTQWWHAYQALPYLLSRGANLEACDHEGETPLIKALDPTHYEAGPFRVQAARQLIAAGANVNAAANNGRTCLSVAGDDVELVQLLIAHGAIVTAEAVFPAVEKRHVRLLETLLSGKGDVHAAMLRMMKPQSQHDTHSEESQEHALFCASMQKSRLPHYRSWDDDEERRGADGDLARVLLAHGADPFATFRVKKLLVLETRTATTPSYVNRVEGENQEDESDFVELTVIHEVLLDNALIAPFLELANLDLERRNSNGQTLLLAACGCYSTFCSTVVLAGHQEPVLLIELLLQRGANVSARDIHGRNALHTSLGSDISGSFPFDHNKDTLQDNFFRAFRLLIAADPALARQADAAGRTPLHTLLAALGNATLPSPEQLVNLLLAVGADRTSIDGPTGDSVLHPIVRAFCKNKACPGLFQRFLSLELDINARNAKGQTPVFGLLEGGMTRNDKEAKGHFAYRRRDRRGRKRYGPVPDEEAWRALEEAGADFTATDNEGRSMLHLAAEEERHVEAYKRLVRMGLDPMAPDARQRTSVDVAAACRNEEVLSIFEREGGELYEMGPDEVKKGAAGPDDDDEDYDL